jgi:hypothetical protein
MEWGSLSLLRFLAGSWKRNGHGRMPLNTMSAGGALLSVRSLTIRPKTTVNTNIVEKRANERLENAMTVCCRHVHLQYYKLKKSDIIPLPF